MSKRHITVEINEKSVSVWNFVNKTEFGAYIKEGIKSLNYDEKIIISNDYKIYKTDNALETGKEIPQEELFVRALTEKEISSNRYEYNGHIYKIVAEDDDTPDKDYVTENASHSDSDREETTMARVDLILKAGYDKLAYETVAKEAVSKNIADIGKKVLDDIQKNGTHHQELKTIRFISFEEYKENTLKKEKRTILEDWVIGIDRVELINTDNIDNTGFVVYHQNGVLVLPFYKLDKSIYKKKGSTKSGKAKYDKYDGHFRHLVGRNRQTSVTYERLVMIAQAVYDNAVPNRLRGLQVNVKDCTGNPCTAQDIGLEQNFHPANLEWVFDKEHGPHYSTCMKCFEITGRAWVVSAFDQYLYELTKNGTYREIAQYLEWFCIPA